MAVDPARLLSYEIPEIVQDLTTRDTILYALSVGLGADPLDKDQLRFVYEDALLALPTMATVLGYAGFWLKHPDAGVDWVKVVHAEQGIRIHQPLPVEGRLVGRTRVTGLVDKGAGKGALLYSERRVTDVAGNLVATLDQTTFLRGDGGCGGTTGPAKVPHPTPERAPDLILDLETSPSQALIYRLNGDYNPLHADPGVATKAGFPRPILHGLATYGVVGHALLKALCGYRPESLKAMDCRFTAPVFPGETIRTEIWHEDGGSAAFRARVIERDAIVLSNGRAEVA
ncbi:MAG: 3-alpha,7-alpha,12-alpha-trihydroxy-5-beta-cholest-24-enoyl-CoA hydratase [Alphaproteobacteria bacterium]|nr:3-alpha,7-alpha,12-alpha-trihydroxy-5-beta-cholest-24-enoyl-CoA hydratase [Alphaproteobacteria bacterium]